MRDLRWLRWWLAGGFALVAVTVYWSLAPSPVGLPDSECDKCGHMLAYFTLMTWFAGVVRVRQRWQLAAALTALGVAIEFLQQATGERVYEWLDIFANVAGIAAAWLVAKLGLAAWAEWIERALMRALRG